MEKSCDESLFKKELDINMKKNYANALLSVASKKNFPTPTPITFDDGRSSKKRIKNILNFHKPKVWTSVLCYILCAVMLVACTTEAKNIDPLSFETEVFGEVKR